MLGLSPTSKLFWSFPVLWISTWGRDSHFGRRLHRWYLPCLISDCLCHPSFHLLLYLPHVISFELQYLELVHSMADKVYNFCRQFLFTKANILQLLHLRTVKVQKNASVDLLFSIISEHLCTVFLCRWDKMLLSRGSTRLSLQSKYIGNFPPLSLLLILKETPEIFKIIVKYWLTASFLSRKAFIHVQRNNLETITLKHTALSYHSSIEQISRPGPSARLLSYITKRRRTSRNACAPSKFYVFLPRSSRLTHDRHVWTLTYCTLRKPTLYRQLALLFEIRTRVWKFSLKMKRLEVLTY